MADLALADRMTGFLAGFAFRVAARVGRCAFFAGALFAAARLTVGLDRADFDLNGRALTDDRETECREFDRRAPFAIGLLIFNPQGSEFKGLSTP